MTTNEERKLIEDVGELIIDLVQRVYERFGKVGVRALVVSEELGKAIGVTLESPATMMTPCGPVRIAVEKTRKVVGPLVRVDAYACEVDHLRVEVGRVPGSDDAKVVAYMEAETGPRSARRASAR
jgi:hypothetical protein